MPLRVVAAGILLGLAGAATVLAVVPPTPEVAQVHHVSVPTPALAAAPGLDADASALLGGRPDAAGVADAVDVTPGPGTLEVRARAETSADAAVVAAAVGTVLERRAAEDGPDGAAARPTALAPDPPRDVGLRPQPAVVLGAGAALGLVAGLLAGRLGAGVGVRGRGSWQRHRHPEVDESRIVNP